MIALYSELFKLIKNKTQVWEDKVSGAEKMSDLQRETMLELKDELVSQIYKTVEALATGGTTASSIAEADDDQSEE